MRILTEIEILREGLNTIINGDYPRRIECTWRKDGQPSKHDRCFHGKWGYEGCEDCVAEYAMEVMRAADAAHMIEFRSITPDKLDIERLHNEIAEKFPNILARLHQSELEEEVNEINRASLERHKKESE